MYRFGNMRRCSSTGGLPQTEIRTPRSGFAALAIMLPCVGFRRKRGREMRNGQFETKITYINGL
jgi:hypothetical protein